MYELLLLGLGLMLLLLTWDHVIKPTYLDEARDELFDIRDKKVRAFFQEEKLGLHDPAYKELREHINGFLRYTERATLMGLMVRLSAEVKGKKENNLEQTDRPVDQPQQHQPTAVDKFSAEIKEEISLVMLKYMIKTSPLGQVLTFFVSVYLNAQAAFRAIKKLRRPAWSSAFSTALTVTTLIAAIAPPVNANNLAENLQEALETQATEQA